MLQATWDAKLGLCPYPWKLRPLGDALADGGPIPITIVLVQVGSRIEGWRKLQATGGTWAVAAGS